MPEDRIEAVIRHYNRHRRSRIDDEARWFRSQPTLRDAISSAALAKGPNGLRLDHQRRLRSPDLRRAEEALLAVEGQFAICTVFEELHSVVLRAVRQIWKDPELYVYDTALRIGAKLGIKPERVYLHRGTRSGAQKLGLDVRRGILEMSALPEELRGLEATEVEDILCIYKDKF